MAQEQAKILLTGATGFIGGTILTHLLAPSVPPTILERIPITCLVRGEDRVIKLRAAYGDRVHPVLYEGLDDRDATIAIAAQHNIVVNTTLGYHSASATALIHGLARRKQETGRDVWMIHTSGTSNLADQPISGKWSKKTPNREFNDASDDVYAYEKAREGVSPYAQRTTELNVVDAGLELGVKTLVIMSPTIFGKGTGLFNTSSIQVPAYAQAVVTQGQGVVVGDGKGVWDYVHVEDLAELYRIVVLRILEHGGKDLPNGKKGIIFSGNGRHSWLEVAQGVTDACYEAGWIKSKDVKSVNLSEGAKILSAYMGGPLEDIVELGLCSNSRTVSSVARSLGWKPTKGEEASKAGFRYDVGIALQKLVDK
ncbi:NAD dependent epimerase/dehydratase family protein-like protein [Lentithecium fluviatile CBS 122367]|uniref:NAD dependent epimerase/dehydratase family protein-like protein n=1 Tax=Lentithecium fluviatile CBS 122367 TaxID=1168545 RepID=A0A6G1IP68_9PLEO|nr:NAD dependent epimerase/dehydratase family protein-like protein [Lentithecium fluviatile CBS 122367]